MRPTLCPPPRLLVRLRLLVNASFDATWATVPDSCPTPPFPSIVERMVATTFAMDGTPVVALWMTWSVESDVLPRLPVPLLLRRAVKSPCLPLRLVAPLVVPPADPLLDLSLLVRESCSPVMQHRGSVLKGRVLSHRLHGQGRRDNIHVRTNLTQLIRGYMLLIFVELWSFDMTSELTSQ